eukprot:TRINITY_DN1276_c0_g2_i7.p1 TRINITY_DN1276_c0_g2~~TRINITY_DN1276_c0_g2_i7.p1  ORF type:complete len:149 (-),score=5.84 TRINITY_DN1276_c0_g2_i7:288-734(-)
MYCRWLACLIAATGATYFQGFCLRITFHFRDRGSRQKQKERTTPVRYVLALFLQDMHNNCRGSRHTANAKVKFTSDYPCRQAHAVARAVSATCLTVLHWLYSLTHITCDMVSANTPRCLQPTRSRTWVAKARYVPVLEPTHHTAKEAG